MGKYRKVKSASKSPSFLRPRVVDANAMLLDALWLRYHWREKAAERLLLRVIDIVVKE